MLLFVASRDKSRNRQFALIVVCSNDGGHGQHVARSLAGSLAGPHKQDRHVARNRAHSQQDHFRGIHAKNEKCELVMNRTN